MNNVVYKISENTTKKDGNESRYIRISHSGFTEYHPAKKALDEVLTTYVSEGYTVSLWYVTFLSAKGDQKEQYMYEVDFTKETKSEE